LSSSLGQPIVLENREGRGGAVGAKLVASAAADGHTLLVTTPGPPVVVPTVVRNLGYDPVRSFTPVATVMTTPHMLVVPPTLAASTTQELLAQAKLVLFRVFEPES
jgi:tripartite-type tricarboxylate transporter receptor subunit TctC